MDNRDRLSSILSTQLSLNSNQNLGRFENNIEDLVDSVIQELRRNPRFADLIQKLSVNQRVAAAEQFLLQQRQFNSPALVDQAKEEDVEVQSKSSSRRSKKGIQKKEEDIASSSSESEKKSDHAKVNGYKVKFTYIRGETQKKTAELGWYVSKAWTMVVVLPNVILARRKYDLVKITNGSFEQIFSILFKSDLHQRTKNVVLVLPPNYFKKKSNADDVLDNIIQYGNGFEKKAKLFVTGFINDGRDVKPKEYRAKLKQFNEKAEKKLSEHGITFVDLRKFLPLKLDGDDWHRDRPLHREVFNDNIMAWVLKEAMNYLMASAETSNGQSTRTFSRSSPKSEIDTDVEFKKTEKDSVKPTAIEEDEATTTTSNGSPEKNSVDEEGTTSIKEDSPEKHGENSEVIYKSGALGSRTPKLPVVALTIENGPRWVLLSIGNSALPVCKDNKFAAYSFNLGSATSSISYLMGLLSRIGSEKNIVLLMNPKWFFKFSSLKIMKDSTVEAEMLELLKLVTNADTRPFHNVYLIGYPTDPQDAYYEGRLGRINKFMESILKERFIDPSRFMPPSLSMFTIERPEKEKHGLLDDELHCYLIKEAINSLMENADEDVVVRMETSDEESSDEEQAMNRDEETNVDIDWEKNSHPEGREHIICLKKQDKVEASFKVPEDLITSMVDVSSTSSSVVTPIQEDERKKITNVQDRDVGESAKNTVASTDHEKIEPPKDTPGMGDWQAQALRLKNEIERLCALVPNFVVGMHFKRMKEDQIRDIEFEVTVNCFARIDSFFKQDMLSIDNNELIGHMVKIVVLKMCKIFNESAIGQIFRQEMELLSLTNRFKMYSNHMQQLLNTTNMVLGVYTLEMWTALFPQIGEANPSSQPPNVKPQPQLPNSTPKTAIQESEYQKLMKTLMTKVKRQSINERVASSRSFMRNMIARKVGFTDNFKKKIAVTTGERDEDFRRLKAAIYRVYVITINTVDSSGPIASLSVQELEDNLQMATSYCVNMSTEMTGIDFKKAIIKCQPSPISDAIVCDMLKQDNDFVGAMFFEFVNHIVMPDRDEPPRQRQPIMRTPSEEMEDVQKMFLEDQQLLKPFDGFKMTNSFRQSILTKLMHMENRVLGQHLHAELQSKNSIFFDFGHQLIYKMMTQYDSYLAHKDEAFNDLNKLGIALKTVISEMLRVPGRAFTVFQEEYYDISFERSIVQFNMAVASQGQEAIELYWSMFLCALVDPDIAKKCKKVGPEKKNVSSASPPNQAFLQGVKPSEKAQKDCNIM